MTSKIAVIGLGNTLRRDDGIGVIILESLLKNYRRRGIDYFNFGVASFDLLNRLKYYDIVLLIDAISSNLFPADLRIFGQEEFSSLQNKNTLSSHELNLEDIFALSAKLGIKTRIYVAGIQVQDTGFGESLSDALKNNLEMLTGKIDKFVEKICATPYPEK